MKNLITQEQVNKSGVYKITNLINGKIYIGCSKNMSYRFRSHLCTLNKGVSGCRILQSAVIKYGLLNFSFEVLEICNNYQEREIVLLKQLKPQYNIVIETEVRRVISEESRRRMSEARRGRPSSLKGIKNPNYKRTKKNKVLYNDVEYENIQVLADYIGCSVQAIYQANKNKTLIKEHSVQIIKV